MEYSYDDYTQEAEELTQLQIEQDERLETFERTLEYAD